MEFCTSLEMYLKLLMLFFNGSISHLSLTSFVPLILRECVKKVLKKFEEEKIIITFRYAYQKIQNNLKHKTGPNKHIAQIFSF